MIYVMIIGGISLLVLSVLGVASAWGLSRLMDRANQSGHASEFRRILDQIKTDPKAAAHYYGCRWIGICLLIGLLFSRAV